jgi:hypothetical protein
MSVWTLSKIAHAEPASEAGEQFCSDPTRPSEPQDYGRRLFLFICEQFGIVPAPAPTQHYWEKQNLCQGAFFDLTIAHHGVGWL